MSTAARSRGLPRLLESVSARVWLIDREGLLVYVSPALCEWLGMSPDDLVGRRCMLPPQPDATSNEVRIGQPSSDADPTNTNSSADRIALALAPTRELLHRGHHTRRISLNSLSSSRKNNTKQPLVANAHFVCLDGTADQKKESDSTESGQTGESSTGTLVLGCMGDFRSDSELPWDDWFGPEGIRQATEVDEQLALHRAAQQRFVSTLLLGTSVAVQRFRSRVELAKSLRHHVGLFGLPGCGSDQLAQQLHQASAPSEPLVVLDGSLMDDELLAAYAEPVLHRLRESTEAKGTLLIERLEEMPLAVQNHLCDWMDHWQGRLRLIGLVDLQVVSGTSSLATTEAADPDDHSLAQELKSLLQRPTAASGLHRRLGTLLATLPIFVPPLSQRLDDLGEVAEAMINQIHASAVQASPLQSSSKAGSLHSKQRSKSARRWLDVPRLSREFVEALYVYPWPSQWKELETAMRYAYGTGSTDRLTRDHLPLVIRSYQPSAGHSPLPRSPSELNPRADGPEHDLESHANEFASLDLLEFKTLDEATQKCERYFIARALRAAEGNKAEAARQLGISRARLLRKLQE